MSANQVIVQQLKSGQLVITIPRSIANLKGIGKGTILEYTENESGELIIKKVKE